VFWREGQYPVVIVKMECYKIGTRVGGGVVLAGLALDIALQVYRFDLSGCNGGATAWWL
jgi:hypothetical protein